MIEIRNLNPRPSEPKSLRFVDSDGDSLTFHKRTGRPPALHVTIQTSDDSLALGVYLERGDVVALAQDLKKWLELNP